MKDLFKNKQVWVLIVLAFIVGNITKSSNTITKEVEIEKIVKIEKKVQVCDREDTWRSLKEVDDTGFEFCAESISVAGEAFQSIVDLDFENVAVKAEKLMTLADETESLVKERTELLDELGY